MSEAGGCRRFPRSPRTYSAVFERVYDVPKSNWLNFDYTSRSLPVDLRPSMRPAASRIPADMIGLKSQHKPVDNLPQYFDIGVGNAIRSAVIVHVVSR
jgi:hypothetical protein